MCSLKCRGNRAVGINESFQSDIYLYSFLSLTDAQMMLPSSTIQHLQSVPNGLVWKHSSSLLTTHSSSSTVTSSYVTQPSQAPSALRNVFKVAVEGVTQVLRWLMMCTLWSRAPSTSNERNESKRSAVLWIKTVSEIVLLIIGYYLLSFWMENV